MTTTILHLLEIENKQFPLSVARIYLVGRRTEAVDRLDIELQNQTIDSKHALIRVCDDGIKVLDLQSKSGTFLNNQRLDGLTEVTIEGTGTLQFGAVCGNIHLGQALKSHESSGFHECPKNNTDICCTPEQVSTSVHHLHQLQKSGLTSTPNRILENEDESLSNKQCEFLMPPAPPVRKSCESNVNDSLGNRSNDSFYIPETQQQYFPLAKLKDKRNCGLSMDKSIPNVSDNDICIPETQEVVLTTSPSSQKLRQSRYQDADEEEAMLDANVPENILAEVEDCGDNDIVEVNKFRICTQDYNEINCLTNGDDSNSIDLLADFNVSIVIPTIKHDAVMLDKVTHVINERNERVSVAEAQEMSAPNWIDKNSSGSTTNTDTLERDNMCTPDLFDITELAQQYLQPDNASIYSDAASIYRDRPKTGDDIEKPSPFTRLCCESSDLQSTDALTNPNDPPLYGAEADLMVTQMFETVQDDASKKDIIVTSKCSPEYITLSDKENMLPPIVAHLEAANADLDTTKIFAARESNINTNDNSREDPQQSTENGFEINVANASDNNAPNDVEEDDQDYQPTQVFNAASKRENAADISSSFSTPMTSIGPKTDIISNDAAEPNLDPLESHTPQKLDDNFSKPIGIAFKKLSTLSNESASESPDIDMLLCTPQIIADNFKPPNVEAKKHILANQRTLFGDDSDEESDVLQLITAPKVSHDFDKLLPHLKTQQMSPERQNPDTELHQYNRAFSRPKESSKIKSKSVDNRKSKRNRDERHMARDKEREKVDLLNEEGTIKNNNKKKAGSSGRNHNGERNKEPIKPTENDEEINKEEDDTIPSRKRTLAEASKGVSKAKSSRKTKETDQAQPTHKAERSKKAKNEMKSEDDKKVIASKKEEYVLCDKEFTRITRSRSQSGSSVNDSSSLNFPARRTTRLRSRMEKLETAVQEGSKVPDAEKSKRSGPKKGVDKSEKLAVQEKDIRIELRKKREVIKDGTNGTQDTSARNQKHIRNSPSSSLKIARTREIAEKPSTSPITHQARELKVSVTMVDPELLQRLLQNSSGIWSIATDPTESDILIMDKGNRTFKYLIAMAKGIPIVNSSWLERINKTGTIVNVGEHFYADKAFERRHNFSILRSIELARKRKLLLGYDFTMTPNILPRPDEMNAIIKCAGGTIHGDDIPSLKDDNQKLYLVSCKEDQKLWHRYRRLNNNIHIIRSEGVMLAVMRQMVEALDEHLLA